MLSWFLFWVRLQLVTAPRFPRGFEKVKYVRIIRFDRDLFEMKFRLAACSFPCEFCTFVCRVFIKCDFILIFKLYFQEEKKGNAAYRGGKGFWLPTTGQVGGAEYPPVEGAVAICRGRIISLSSWSIMWQCQT